MTDTSAPLILSLETATKCSSVALTRGSLTDGEVLACLSFNSDISHSRRLIDNVDILFRETRVDWDAIAAVAVGLGPGSFTGLRIGMATGKGFAAAGGKRLLGAATLDALAAQCSTTRRICAVIDARKKQVYSAMYRYRSGSLLRETPFQVQAPERLVEEIGEAVLMVGDGVLTYGDLFAARLGGMVSFAPRQLHVPSAAAVGLLCGGLLADGRCLDIAAAAPVYVRASDAELSLADIQQRKRNSPDDRSQENQTDRDR